MLLRRVGALVADIGAALFLSGVGVLFAQSAELADGTSRFIMPMTVCVFVFLRTVGASMGNSTLCLRVDGSSVVKNFVRVLALLAPGYNLFDWGYAVRNPRHQTFTDTKLGIRVFDDTLR